MRRIFRKYSLKYPHPIINVRELFEKVLNIIENIRAKYKCNIHARWAFQKVRNGTSLNCELRIYTCSPLSKSRDISLILAEELRRLGFGAHVRTKDTFITVRRGKEALAAILYKLGILNDLTPKDLPKITRRKVLEFLKIMEGKYNIIEISENNINESITSLIEEIYHEYERTRDIDLLREKYECYLKVKENYEQSRESISNNIDYITWLTICDGTLSLVVDNNVDTLQYGTTGPELVTVLLRSLRIVKLSITGIDSKTGKPHIVAVLNNYIIREVYGEYISELDKTIERIRKIINNTRQIILNYLAEKYDIETEENIKTGQINKILKQLYFKNRYTIEDALEIAQRNVKNIENNITDPIKALAGTIDGDGTVEKQGGGYGVAIALAPYTVKGVAVLTLIKYLEYQRRVVINGFNNKNLELRIWLSPRTREQLVQYVKHPRRLERLRELCQKHTTSIIERSHIEIDKALKAVQEVLEFLEKNRVKMYSIWKVREGGKKRTLLLELHFEKYEKSTKLSEIASKVVEILRKYEIGAYKKSKSAIIEIKRGKIELAYILRKLGILKELIPEQVDKELLKILIARVEKLEQEETK